VLALAAYISAWLVLPAAAHHGYVSHETAQQLENTVFDPIDWYCDRAALPGGESLIDLWDALNGQYFD